MEGYWGSNDGLQGSVWSMAPRVIAEAFRAMVDVLFELPHALIDDQAVQFPSASIKALMPLLVMNELEDVFGQAFRDA
jgi:hypothetical protein